MHFINTVNMCRKRGVCALLCCLWLLAQLANVQGYSQVLINGNGNNEGPKLFKALNMDLIFPRTFNSSENVISTTQTPISVAASAAAAAATITTPTSAPTSLQTNYHTEQQQQQQQSAPEQGQQSDILYVTPANDVLPTVGAAAEAFGAFTPAAGQSTDEAPAETAVNPMWTTVNEQQQEVQPAAEREEQPAEEQQLQEFASTGRAVDYRPSNVYNLNQLITPLIKNSPRPLRPAGGRPIYARPTQTQSTSGLGKIIYPQAYQQQQQRQPNRAEINKLHGKGTFSDRFTPGEAVAAGTFAHHHHNHQHNRRPSSSKNNGNKTPASSNIVQTYTPPKNLYSFPPNINSKYPPPAKDPKATLPSNSVNSYVPPPSGTLTSSSGFPLVAAASSNTNGYKYAGPVSPAYLPPDDGKANGNDIKGGDDQKGADDSSSDSDEGNDDTIGVLPASAMDAGNDGKDAAGNGDDMGDMKDMGGAEEHDHPPPDDDKEYPTPPPGWVEEHPDTAHDHPHDDHLHDHPHDDHLYDHPHDDHIHDHPFTHDAPIIYDHDHHHDHDHDHYFDHHFDYHDHFPSFPHYYHHHPEIIYDDHHDHHVEMPTLPPVTTELPPEPAPEPRVKKYSYFYIGRKLWYIPLYFTVWFSFYVLWLILKSIARHKVNLPNHYVNRRSLPDYSDKAVQEHINQLTVAVLKKIDDYSRKQQYT